MFTDTAASAALTLMQTLVDAENMDHGAERAALCIPCQVVVGLAAKAKPTANPPMDYQTVLTLQHAWLLSSTSAAGDLIALLKVHSVCLAPPPRGQVHYS